MVGKQFTNGELLIRRCIVYMEDPFLWSPLIWPHVQRIHGRFFPINTKCHVGLLFFTPNSRLTKTQQKDFIDNTAISLHTLQYEVLKSLHFNEQRCLSSVKVLQNRNFLMHLWMLHFNSCYQQEIFNLFLTLISCIFLRIL